MVTELHVRITVQWLNPFTNKYEHVSSEEKEVSLMPSMEHLIGGGTSDIIKRIEISSSQRSFYMSTGKRIVVTFLNNQ